MWRCWCGLFKWMVLYPDVPLAVIPEFRRDVDKPLMQEALVVLDNLPELSQEIKAHIVLWRNYQHLLTQEFTPGESLPSYEMYIQYGIWRMRTGDQSTSLKNYYLAQVQYYQQQQQQSMALTPASVMYPAIPSSAPPPPPPPPRPSSTNSPFAAAPGPQIAFNPALAAQVVTAEQQQRRCNDGAHEHKPSTFFAHMREQARFCCTFLEYTTEQKQVHEQHLPFLTVPYLYLCFDEQRNASQKSHTTAGQSAVSAATQQTQRTRAD